jgi:hypothetical protein
VEEVNQGGSVPDLLVENKSGSPVLFLEGEELRVAKRNRVLNTSVLKHPAHSTSRGRIVQSPTPLGGHCRGLGEKKG